MFIGNNLRVIIRSNLVFRIWGNQQTKETKYVFNALILIIFNNFFNFCIIFVELIKDREIIMSSLILIIYSPQYGKTYPYIRRKMFFKSLIKSYNISSFNIKRPRPFGCHLDDQLKIQTHFFSLKF